jgi:ribulose-phosphate 3-epimerase
MTVEPGFGGQAFMPATLAKVAALRAAAPALDVQVDGGVGPATAAACAAAGANVLVAGSALFGAKDFAAAVAAMVAAAGAAAAPAGRAPGE